MLFCRRGDSTSSLQVTSFEISLRRDRYKRQRPAHPFLGTPSRTALLFQCLVSCPSRVSEDPERTAPPLCAAGPGTRSGAAGCSLGSFCPSQYIEAGESRNAKFRAGVEGAGRSRSWEHLVGSLPAWNRVKRKLQSRVLLHSFPRLLRS